MAKLLAGFLIASLMTMLTPSDMAKGLRDASTSMLNWNYFPIRDMRRTIALAPQKIVTRTPPEGGVPTEGVDVEGDLATLAATLTNPVPVSEAALAAGELQYRQTCVPCHGPDMKGDGPVIQFYVPPPDLLGPLTRGRSDGHMYSYIRNGGAIMPAYGFQISPEMTWNLIHYINARQQASPR
jgi:mono/diheme cytochrome c family protein